MTHCFRHVSHDMLTWIKRVSGKASRESRTGSPTLYDVRRSADSRPRYIIPFLLHVIVDKVICNWSIRGYIWAPIEVQNWKSFKLENVPSVPIGFSARKLDAVEAAKKNLAPTGHPAFHVERVKTAGCQEDGKRAYVIVQEIKFWKMYMWVFFFKTTPTLAQISSLNIENSQ